MRSYILPLCDYASRRFARLCLFSLFLMLLSVFSNTIHAQANVTTDKDDYYPGETLMISGAGWQPGETVELKILELPVICTKGHTLFAIADEQGNISNSQFLFNWSHLGVSFSLTATGTTSNQVAYTNFTDAPIVQVLTISNQAPTCVTNPLSVVYDVHIGRTNQGANGVRQIDLSVASLPVGISGTFYSNSSFSTAITSVNLDRNEVADVKLRITGSGTVGSAPSFTVTASAGGQDFITSSTQSFNISQPVAISNQPSNSSITYGMNTGFSVSASGAISYQWEVSAGGVAAFVPINTDAIYSGTNTSSLILTKPPVSLSSNKYRCVITGSCGNVPTAAATLNVAKAEQTITWTNPLDIIYGTLLGASQLNAVVSGVSGGSSPGALTYTPAAGTLLNAGSSQVLHLEAAATSDYNPSSKDVFINVQKADAQVSVSGYSNVYDAQAHGASGTATGVGGIDLSSGLSFGQTFINVPGGTANWNFDGGTNYNNQSGSVPIVITKADAQVSVSGYNAVYDAMPHGATGTATGIGGVDLSSALSLGSTFTDVPGGTANWNFDGGTNYNNQSGSVSIVITKADAQVSVSGYNAVYDAMPHGATGTATGIGGVDLSSALSLGSTFTDVPGGTTNWSFDGGINYNNQSGSVPIVITKADAIVNVSSYTGTYDAQAHGATGTATGVGGVDLSPGLSLGSTFTDVPGGTANWSFDGGTNYNNKSGSVPIVITKADAQVSVSGYNAVYDAQPHGASGTATGIGGVDLSSGLSLGQTFTNVPGGTANWSFDGGINYNNQSGSVAIVITKADAIVNVSGYTGTYDAQAHGATGTATGVGGIDLSSGLSLGQTFTNVPGGTANWNFDGGINYNNESGSVAIVITKADATVNVSGYTGIYDAQAHGATGTATGVGGVDLSAGLSLGANFTNVPGGTANWSFDGGNNYNNQSGSVNISITKRPASVTPNAASKYCGLPDPAIFTGELNGFIGTDKVVATYSRTTGNSAGVYMISASLSATGNLNNYSITYNTASFTILSINTVDASATANSYSSGASVPLSATISPAVEGITVTFTLTPGVGSSVTYSAVTDANGVAIKTVTGLSVNLYKVSAVAGIGCAISPDVYLTVYDPNAGFVTGGGWFISPVVSGLPYMQVSGKANFGFNAQYKKGSQTAVDGNTEFQFQAGNLNFKSSNYTATSLVIAGGKAIYKGTGTINGTGIYQFMVSAIDGGINGGQDRFRIKIWDANGVVYDNNYGVDDNGDPATLLGGGSIVIHLTKSGKAAMTEDIPLMVSAAFNVTAYPTLTNSYFTLKVSTDSQAKITARITDLSGKTIEALRLTPNQNEYFGHHYKAGIYLVEVLQGNQRKVLKVLKQ